MKFRKFGKTVLTAALGSAVVFSLSSCVHSFTSGYLYVTGTVTGTPAGDGIISGFNNCKNPNITQFVVGGNGILTPQETFFTEGSNPTRLISDSSGSYLFALDQNAPASTFCTTVSPGAASCGDVTVFSINSTTGRLSVVTNAQLTSSSGTPIAYFPVPANPLDIVNVGGYLFTLSGVRGVKGGQFVYPYGYSSLNGQLSVTESTPQVVNNGSGGVLDQARAMVSAGGKIYILDTEPLTATVNGATTTSPSQILPFTIGNNGALQSVTGGAIQNDPNETDPIYLILESKGKFAYVANQQGATTSAGAGIAGFFIDPASGILSEDGGSPWGTGSNPQCLIEDPSNQFIYTANAGDSTVTGRVISPNTGDLTEMKGSTGTFPLQGPASWCIVTGRTN